MRLTENTRRAYSEVDEFISLLTKEQKKKLPTQIRNFFNKEKELNYVKGISTNIPINEQNLMSETLAIIAWLNLEYWCEDEDEKEALREVYAKNQKNYESTFQIAFNPDEIFKSKVINEEKQTSNDIVEYKKENVISKILNKLRSFFNKNRS